MSRSKFSLSSYNLTTANMGQVFPIGCLPVLPADTIGHVTNALTRVTPLAAPVMHQVDVRIHHFYCANRILWPEDDSKSGWESFITGGEDGMNTDTIPILVTDGIAGGLLDKFNIPPGAGAGIEVNSLPVIAFNKIWNEFYRDQDLQTKRTDTDLTVPQCAWAKDYLTLARPWSAKGPQVSIPVGDQAPVRTSATVNPNELTVKNANNNDHFMDASASTLRIGSADAGQAGYDLYADLTNATGADPIDVRTAWGIQKFMENAAKYGSRYPERMRQLGSQYKGLMDRPVYLGGGSNSINFSEVLQTAQDTADRAFGIGDMYGHGISASRTNKYAKRIDEHGYVISCMSVRPKSLYMDGVDREWLKTDREDFYDPFLAAVGMQEVFNSEVNFNGTDGKQVFGFSDRYDEYRWQQSRVNSEFRDLLDYWHLGRDFAGVTPTLNASFIECDPTKRVFNEQTQDSLWIMAHHKIAAHRNMPRTAGTHLT